MAKGIFRDGDHAYVDYGTTARTPMPRSDYEVSGYEPPFEYLPTREVYEADNA